MKSLGLLLCLLLVGKGIGSPDDYAYDTAANADGDPSLDYDDEVASTVVDTGPPSFNVLPQMFTPKVGDTIELPCTSDKNQSDVLIFKKRAFNTNHVELLIAAGDVFLGGNKDNRISKENNIFTLRNVKKRDSAFYECVYQYDGMRINVTHSVNVHFQPSIRQKQKTIEVTKGETVILNCSATGNPTPRIVWSKQDGEMPSGAEEEEGLSITFENVDRRYGGSYMCTADNGVGNPATASREIVVSYPPEIRTENEMVHTGKDDRVEMVCIVHAYPTAEVTWTHEGVPVDSDTTAEVHDGGHRHQLTIDSVSDQDIGHYTCQASNIYGTTEMNIYLTDAPSTPSITSDPHSAEEESYTLTWTTDSYYPIENYQLMYRKTKANESTDEPGDWVKIIEVPEESEQEGTVRTFRQTLSDLDRATDYEAMLTISNSANAAEEVNFSFSTRKETAGQHQTTTSGTERLVFSVLLQSVCTALLFSIILPS